MKAMQFIILPVLLICFIACADKRPAEDTTNNNDRDTAKEIIAPTKTSIIDTLESGKVIDRVICTSDANQSYALYIPKKAISKTSPVIYFFDPHSNGSLPLNKYKTLADKYDFILIGSNNSKNGNDWPTTENIWRTLFSDSKSRVKINPDRIYVCGFSGGAKVAGYVALNHPEVKAVIANGAGLPDGFQAANFNFSFTAIAGEGDMNMTDLVAFNTDLNKTTTRHRIILFDGIHEWAPENIMDIAFNGLQLDAMNEKLIPKDDGVISDYITKSKERLNKYIAANKLVNAGQECKLSINMLEGLTSQVSWFKDKDALLTSGKVYQKQWSVQQNLLLTEQNLKAGFGQQFQEGDINYWTKTISDLQTKATIKTAESAMYQRLLAYLSLAFYSLSNRFISANRDAEAGYFVALYKLADPINSEAWYFSAVINARINKVKEAANDLLKAVEFGFTDQNRMMRQPEFQKLATQINFAAIESKMKKGK